jgi:hypothetical protein
MTPVIANQRPLRHLFFLLACRPPHPSSHWSRQFAPARIAIVLFRINRHAPLDLPTPILEQTDRTPRHALA